MTGHNVTTRLILATLLAAFFATGCFTTQLAVPYGESVTLLPENAPASYHKEWKNWYALWGMYPIADTQPEVIIRDEKLRQVRVRTQDKIEDTIIAFFLGPFSILPQSVAIDGNR